MDRWMDGVPYEDCLISKRADWLLDVKVNGAKDESTAVVLANDAVGRMTLVKDSYMDFHTPKIDRGVDEILNATLVDLFKKNFLSEIQNEKE
jgi:hypothetical protein